VYSNSRTS